MSKKIHRKLEAMFLKHYDEWCMHAYTYLQNLNEAEEVVQDVCVNILLRKEGTEILNLRAYTLIAIRNKSLKKLKQNKKYETLNETNIRMSPSSEDMIILSEERLHLQKAIASIPEPSRSVFERCVVDGQKYKNVASDLDISVNTVKYHIKKAYRILRINIDNVYLTIIFLAILMFL